MAKAELSTGSTLAVQTFNLGEDGIESRILLMRGQKVLFDLDLAALYEVKAIALRQQLRRNPKRFPSDFVFKLSNLEIASLLSQNVIPSRKVFGGATPLAFTQQGIAMLSSVLTSEPCH